MRVSLTFNKYMHVSLTFIDFQQVYACFIDNKYMRVSLTFNRHITRYSTMVCFINLVLKSMTLSYTPDSEHI